RKNSIRFFFFFLNHLFPSGKIKGENVLSIVAYSTIIMGNVCVELGCVYKAKKQKMYIKRLFHQTRHIFF
ncbi:Uncharacterized protein APZ42_005060, partial [Daphnia magna]